MRDYEPIDVPDSVSDVSKWSRCPCPTCGATAEMRWTGLRTVASTGCEEHAEKQWRPPEFISPSDGPFVVQEQVGLPGDRIVFSAVDPSTGITTGAYAERERAEGDARAMNAAYWLGRNHESYASGKVIEAARECHRTRQDDVCNDAPHSVHIDANAAIALADAIEWYDRQVTR